MEIEPYNDCKKCKKLVEGQRKILYDMRIKLVNILVKYHDLVKELDGYGITKDDINITDFFDETKSKQKPFVDMYNDRIDKTGYLVMYEDKSNTILAYTPNVEKCDNIIINSEMNIDKFKLLHNKMIKQEYL